MASIRTQCVSLLVRIIAIAGFLSCGSLLAQTTGLSFVKTLEPPAAAPSQMPVVALAGDTAITAYEATETQPWQIWYRNPDPASVNGWSEPVLLVEGDAESGSTFHLSADGPVIAVGLPDAAGGEGEIYIYRTATSGESWRLETVISASSNDYGSLGYQLTLRGDLLLAATGWSVRSFAFNHASRAWGPAGWQIDAPSPYFEFATDGERIAFCWTFCYTVIRDENGVWTGEAHVPPRPRRSGDSATALHVSGEWMLYGGRLYHRVGSEWQHTQSIVYSRAILRGDSILIWNGDDGELSIWKADGTVWTQHEVVGHLDGFGGSIALAGDQILAGIQSFSRSAQGWQPSGSAGGIRDHSQGFGAALAIDDDKIRVGVPGSDRIDLDAGEMARYRLGGPDAEPIGAPLVAPGHVPYRDFARNLLVAEDLVLASQRQGRWSPGSILAFDRNSENLVDEIPLPEDRYSAAMALQGATLAVITESASDPLAETSMLIFHRGPAGFDLVQEIPEQGDEFTTGFGSTIIQHGDWLLTGETLFRRDGPESDFVRVRQLERPDDLPLNTSSMVSDGDNLIVPPMAYSQRLAFLYRFDAMDGWVLSGEVRREPPLDEDFGFCNALTIQADTAVCAYESWTDEKFELLAMRPIAGQSDWAVSETLPLDVTGVGRMTSAGAHVALVVDDGVMVFLTGEAIFDNGFE